MENFDILFSFISLNSFGQYLSVWAKSPVWPQILHTRLLRTGHTTFNKLSLRLCVSKSFKPEFEQNLQESCSTRFLKNGTLLDWFDRLVFLKFSSTKFKFFSWKDKNLKEVRKSVQVKFKLNLSYQKMVFYYNLKLPF